MLFEIVESRRHFKFELLKQAGFDPHIRAKVVTLPPEHPYLPLPLQFATSLRPRLLEISDHGKLDELITSAAKEIEDVNRRGLSFTLVQTWARAQN